MVRRVVITTSNAERLLDYMHELGKCWFKKSGVDPDTKDDTYKVVYFSSNTQVFFDGRLNKAQLETIQKEGVQAKSIVIDEFNLEIRIEI